MFSSKFFGLLFTCVGILFISKYYHLHTSHSAAIIAKPTKSIVLISVSVPNKAKGVNFEWVYVFHAVTSVLAWERIGFQTVLLFVIDYNKIQPKAKRLMRHIITTALEWKAKVVYLDISSDLKVRTSQLIRIYAASLLQQLDPHDYLITSDADLWVIRKERVVLPNHKKILITNANCCGTTSFKNITFPMYPMCHVGMSVSFWRQMFPLKISRSTTSVHSKVKVSFPNEKRTGFDRNFFRQADIQEFYNMQISNFGAGFYKKASHGDELWYVDQIYMSYILYLFQLNSGNHLIEFNTDWPCARIDRAHWFRDIAFAKCMEDTHLLHGDVWKKSQWGKTNELIKQIFDNSAIDKMESYRRQFEYLMLSS